MFARNFRLGLYLNVAWVAFRQRLVYKADVAMGVFSQFVILFVQISVWQALFASGPSANGVTLQDMVTYVVLGALVYSFTRSGIDYRIAERVQDGTIAIDFVRPVHFKYYMMSEDAGENGFRTLFTALPACLFGALYWGLRFPEDPWTLLLSVATLAGGTVLIYQLNYVLGLLSFWFKESYHVDWLFGAMQAVFSGGLVPLWFYPPLLRTVSRLFPWQLVSFAPLAVFLEKYDHTAAFRVLGLQALWLLILVAAERALWLKAQEKIEIYGG